jgi:type IV pilus assembly protein PilE
MARTDALSAAVRGTDGAGHRTGGFSLVELLLVVTLVGILAAVAIPSYNAYIVRGQRSAAKATLTQASQFLERNYTVNGCYNFATPGECQAGAGVPLVLPASLQKVPVDGNLVTYTVALSYPVSAGGTTGFLVTATPCGETTCTAGTSNTTFDDPDCGALSLDNTGAKNAGGTIGAAGTPEKCWAR